MPRVAAPSCLRGAMSQRPFDLRPSVRVSAVERRSNALLYSWASLWWAETIRKPSIMSATLCSTFSVARLTLSSCPTRVRPIEQTTQLSAYKLNRFSKEHDSLQKHLICAYPYLIDILRGASCTEWMSLWGATQTSCIIMLVTPRKFYVPVETEGAERERERERERETSFY